MDILNTFLVSNVSLTLIALAAFFALRRAVPSGYAPERGRGANLAGLTGIAASVAMVSTVGAMYL